LLDTTSEKFGASSQMTYFVRQYIHQLSLYIRSAIGESAFEMVPDTFVWIQFRSL